MIRPRVSLLAVFALAVVPGLPQSVISTHSGLVYFFDGAVSIGDQPLHQRFGRFPEIGEGSDLRTANGRAEVLLTPGVFLRIAPNSGVRMISTSFSDTRVELLGGSAILEANESAANSAVTLIHRNWRVQLPHEGVYRIDSEPPQVSVYRGEAMVSAEEDPHGVPVQAGQTLPLAAVLVPDPSRVAVGDEFKSWAMSRSQAITSDNATAAGIIDDPSKIEDSVGTYSGFGPYAGLGASTGLDASGLGAVGGLSYFPLTGIPGVAVTNPYGLSFWSPFQSTLSSIYFPPYGLGYLYPSGWPSAMRLNTWRPTALYPIGVTPSGLIGVHQPIGGGFHPGGTAPLRPLMIPPSRPITPAAPHVGVRPGAVHR